MRRWSLALGCVATLITGCGAPVQQVDDPTGIAWQLTEGVVDGDPVPIVDGYPITLSLTDEGAGGTAACNGYGGMYEIAGAQITFSELLWTEMACVAEGVMESEQTYLEGLLLVGAYSMTEDSLTLSGEQVQLDFTALPPAPTAELTGTVWVLETLLDGDAASSVNGDRATLELFTDGSMLGSTGCRTLDGQYIVSGAEVAMTEMTAHGECPAELEAQDGHVVTVLGDGFSTGVDGQVLTLTSSGDLGLVYRSDS
jgi:heat shock protein HslJ